MFRVLLLSAMLTMAITHPAFAYVDPGGATIILQIVAAIGAGGILMIRRVRAFVAGLFSRRGDTHLSNEDKAE